MCYTILVIEKYCRRKHIQAAKLCWRQCRTQAASSYSTNNWRQLCDNRKRTDEEHEAWYPFTPQASDPVCDVCLCLENDPETRELRTILDPADLFIRDCENALIEQAEAQDRVKDVLVSDPPDMTEVEKNQLAQEFHVLFKTQQFLRSSIDTKLEQVKKCQDRYDEIERRFETIYGNPLLDRALALFDRRCLIYMGRPDKIELDDLDCPRHLLKCDTTDCEILAC